jgi:hypothetical protein
LVRTLAGRVKNNIGELQLHSIPYWQ